MPTSPIADSPAAVCVPAESLPGGHGDLRSIEIKSKHGWYRPFKFVCEYCLALAIATLATPVILVAAIIVKLSSRGPAFYLQTRLGLNGRRFRIIKLRTMVQNAEASTGPVWATENDPRITPVGRFLRDSHIDEFPQLLNVLLGQMALVGPRPERPEIADALEWQISSYRQRLKVRPGITGLAQLKLPPDSDLDGVRKKLVHDLYYVRSLNPWLDIRVLLTTGWLLLATAARHLWSLVALPSAEKVNRRVEPIMGEQSELVAADRNRQTD